MNHHDPSSIHSWGVQIEIKPEEEWEFANNKQKERAQLWIRLEGEKCRHANRDIKITNKQTSSATTHLDTQHKMKRERTAVCGRPKVGLNIYMMQFASVLA